MSRNPVTPEAFAPAASIDLAPNRSLTLGRGLKMRRKVGCPREGCDYYVTAERAEDAMDDLREHLKMAHDINEIPDEVRESVAGKIRSASKARR